MNTCATCKHWEAPDQGEYANTPVYDDKRFGKCNKILGMLDVRDYLPEGSPRLHNQLAIMTYDVTEFATRPEFGCVLWEEK